MSYSFLSNNLLTPQSRSYPCSSVVYSKTCTASYQISANEPSISPPSKTYPPLSTPPFSIPIRLPTIRILQIIIQNQHQINTNPPQAPHPPRQQSQSPVPVAVVILPKRLDAAVEEAKTEIPDRGSVFGASNAKAGVHELYIQDEAFQIALFVEDERVMLIQQHPRLLVNPATRAEKQEIEFPALAPGCGIGVENAVGEEVAACPSQQQSRISRGVEVLSSSRGGKASGQTRREGQEQR
ncbi:hypothetical protein MMC21_005474 [Puttea exsequens]|nr:hypothetical protein [Puttea exsequens]